MVFVHVYEGVDPLPIVVPCFSVRVISVCVFFDIFIFSGHERGQAGGGWGGDDRKSATNQWSSSSRRGGGGGVVMGDSNYSSTTYENSGIEQEQLLVDKILAPGGVRVAPPREDLNKFISRYSAMHASSSVWVVGLCKGKSSL